MHKKDKTLCALNRGTCNEQYKGDKDMKQSDRLRYVKEYRSNPLRKEYERKRNMICSNKPITVHLINLGYLFFFAMLFFYGWIFFSDNAVARLISNSVDNFVGKVLGGLSFLGTLIIIVFGIVNIFLGLVYLSYSFEWKKKLTEKHNSEKLEKLDKEYREKGLYPFFESDLFEHSCCEYDDKYEMNVCSITKRMISYSDYNYCSRPGNCRHCKTFMTAYLGEDYNGEFDHEFK